MASSIRSIYRKQALKRTTIIIIAVIIFSSLYTLFAYQRISTNTATLISQKDSLYKVAYDKKARELREYSRELSEEKGETVSIYLSDERNKEIFDKEFNTDFNYEIIRYNIGVIIVGLILIIIISVFLYFLLKDPPLYCPYCYKTILPKSIIPFICPFCKTKNLFFKSFYKHCENSSCKSVIPAIQCPHCNEEVGLLADYDFQKINEKRYGKKTKI